MKDIEINSDKYTGLAVVFVMAGDSVLLLFKVLNRLQSVDALTGEKGSRLKKLKTKHFRIWNLPEE